MSALFHFVVGLGTIPRDARFPGEINIECAFVDKRWAIDNLIEKDHERKTLIHRFMCSAHSTALLLLLLLHFNFLFFGFMSNEWRCTTKMVCLPLAMATTAAAPTTTWENGKTFLSKLVSTVWCMMGIWTGNSQNDFIFAFLVFAFEKKW